MLCPVAGGKSFDPSDPSFLLPCRPEVVAGHSSVLPVCMCVCRVDLCMDLCMYVLDVVSRLGKLA